MAKYYGVIGFNTTTKETAPDVFEEDIIERRYTGDVIRNTRRWNEGEHLNDDLTISSTISIVADAYAYQNFHNMRYIYYMGTRWKVNNVEVNRPRLLLHMGGVYNGPDNAVRC